MKEQEIGKIVERAVWRVVLKLVTIWFIISCITLIVIAVGK